MAWPRASRASDLAALHRRIFPAALRRTRSPGTRAARAATTAPTAVAGVACRQQSGRGGTAVLDVHARIGSTTSRARRRCSTSWASTSSMRASRRLDGGFSLDIYLVLEDTGDADRRSPPHSRDRAAAAARAVRARRITLPVRSRGARRARCACSRRRRRSRSATIRCNSRTIVELIAGDRPGLLSRDRQGVHGRAGRRLQLRRS